MLRPDGLHVQPVAAQFKWRRADSLKLMANDQTTGLIRALSNPRTTSGCGLAADRRIPDRGWQITGKTVGRRDEYALQSLPDPLRKSREHQPFDAAEYRPDLRRLGIAVGTSRCVRDGQMVFNHDPPSGRERCRTSGAGARIPSGVAFPQTRRSPIGMNAEHSLPSRRPRTRMVATLRAGPAFPRLSGSGNARAPNQHQHRRCARPQTTVVPSVRRRVSSDLRQADRLTVRSAINAGYQIISGWMTGNNSGLEVNGALLKPDGFPDARSTYRQKPAPGGRCAPDRG